MSYLCPQSFVPRPVVNSVLASVGQRTGLPLPRGRVTFPSPGFQMGQNGAFASIVQGPGQPGFQMGQNGAGPGQGQPVSTPIRPMNLGNDHSMVGGFQAHLLNMRHEHNRLKPDNTKLAYDGKQMEFLEFCEYEHPSNPTLGLNSSTVTPGKVFEFLYYVSRRAKRKSGIRKVKFDSAEYEIIKNNVDYCAECPIGESTMKHYHDALMRLCQMKIDAGTNNFTKEQIMSESTKFLIKSVRMRKARVEQQNCVQKNTYSTHSFEVAKKLLEIEQWMWER